MLSRGLGMMPGQSVNYSLRVNNGLHQFCVCVVGEKQHFFRAVLQRNRVSLVCSVDICPIFLPFCLPCFYSASLGSCSKISFSTAGVTKPRQSPTLLSVWGGKISLFPPFDFELVLTINKVRWNVTVFPVMFGFVCKESHTWTAHFFRLIVSFIWRLDSKQKWP